MVFPVFRSASVLTFAPDAQGILPEKIISYYRILFAFGFMGLRLFYDCCDVMLIQTFFWTSLRPLRFYLTYFSSLSVFFLIVLFSFCFVFVLWSSLIVCIACVFSISFSLSYCLQNVALGVVFLAERLLCRVVFVLVCGIPDYFFSSFVRVKLMLALFRTHWNVRTKMCSFRAWLIAFKLLSFLR